MYDVLLLNWRNKQVKPKPNRDTGKNVLNMAYYLQFVTNFHKVSQLSLLITKNNNHSNSDNKTNLIPGVRVYIQCYKVFYVTQGRVKTYFGHLHHLLTL